MTHTATADIAIPAYARNRAGFPIVKCGRCGGSGLMPYSYAGGQCFGCTGSGWVAPKGRPADLLAEWNRLLRTAAIVDTSARIDAETGAISCALNPGDQVRNTYMVDPEQAKDIPWRTVARVEIGNLNGGSSSAGCWPDGTMRLRSLGLAVTIHYTDGSTSHGGCVLTRQVDPSIYARRDELAAQARTLYERTLTNRARREQRARAAA